MLKISDVAASSVADAILVTGSARSGTTIMGKIVSSLETVEYAYEPPMLFTLFALIQRMDKEQWKLLYETYLYEEFLMNALAGRTFNFNRVDNSAIFRVMPEQEIQRRLDLNLSKAEAEGLAPGRTLAYKMPDIVSFVPTLKSYYPGTRVIVMLRDATETINSVMQRKWFSDENVRKSLIWPFREVNSVRVPYWVKEEDDDLWSRFSELDRTAYYYIRINEEVENIEGRIDVFYDRLVTHPHETVVELVNTLGLTLGEKTEEIIGQIGPTDAERDRDVVDAIDSRLREQVKFYSSKSVWNS